MNTKPSPHLFPSKGGQIKMNGMPWQKRLGAVLFLSGLFLFCAGDLQAQQETTLELTTSAEKEIPVKKQGQWVTAWGSAEQTAPGDLLKFTITYANTGKGDVINAVIVNPIPPGLVVNPKDAAGDDASVTCSIDNGRSYLPPPIMVQTKRADGTLESKPVPLESYTHIRWIIKKPVHPGQSGRVIFTAKVK